MHFGTAVQRDWLPPTANTRVDATGSALWWCDGLMTSTKLPHHPSVLAEAEQRSADVQLRVADLITKFAGSMLFVYLHAVIFAIWMLFVEKSPWPTLTLVVSLEAIFLSTFVMIGQNRQADFQQKKADHDFVANEQELKLNTDLTQLVAKLTKEIHAKLITEQQNAGAGDS
jgi:uncharacterized membrane protein